MEKYSNNARIVLEKRYLLKDARGNFIETPDQFFKRVAKAIAAAEKKIGNGEKSEIWENEFYALLSSLDFLPNTPTLMNAGTELGQLSACFVLPVEDDLNSIFDTLKNAALIQQSGGGTGFNFSKIRPEGDFVYKTGGKASGPVSFMKIFNCTTHYVKQGGKRRGANMGILNIDHPDILLFIQSKTEISALSHFNISVGVTDAFMEAVEKDEDWNLIHPSTRKITSTIKARALWHEIIRCAWESGDPGLIFLDEINRNNPTPTVGSIDSTNPCGEVPLLPYEACNLGSINLSHMLKSDDGKTEIDWNKLSDTVYKAIRFLDNTITVNNYVIQETEEVVLSNRKIGLGVMGWAEMLIKLGIPYNSEKAVELGEKVMSFIHEESLNSSEDLAKERGVFPNWEKSIHFPDKPMRNATVNSIAPTGTISILAGTSPSIEPLFALVFERRHILEGEKQLEINHFFKEYLDEQEEVSTGELMDLAADGESAVLEKLPDELKKLFPTALSIKYDYHIKHQIAFQKHTDNAVSKTINLPESATIKDVENAYMLAWKYKTRGITVYRYNSKDAQVMNMMDGADVACRRCVG